MCMRLFKHTCLKVQTRCVHKYLFSMDKAYFRQSDNERFHLTFHYSDLTSKVNRQFNFCRQLSETVESFLDRVNINVQKVLMKKKKKKEKSPEEDNSGLHVTTLLTANNVEVDGESLCGEIFQLENRVILKLLEKEYFVIINSPWIESVALPGTCLANFPFYPTKFECVHTVKKLSNFVWYKSKDKLDWIEVGEGFIYIPSNDDLNAYLKFHCTPKNEHSEGPIVEKVSDVAVQASPGECPFDRRHGFTKLKASGKEFRVVSYNILADLYCDSDFSRTQLYPYCPEYALNIDYRKLLIVKEILGYNADIICLQEVDRRVFTNDLELLFSNLDYESNFTVKGGLVAEGLACFYNSNRFGLLDSTRIVLSEHISTDPIYSDIWEKVQQNTKLCDRILQRTTAVQTLSLASVEHREIVLVANTHLYFHPDADHIRLLQCGLIMKHIQDVYTKLQNEHKNKRISVLVCGDFNSVPECGIYRLMTTGTVSQDCIDFQSNKEESINNVNLSQPFLLGSACGTPKYTNYTAGFADCLDYIFYDKSNLTVSQVIPMPTDEEIMLHTALPSIVFPSDHISIVSDLKWK